MGFFSRFFGNSSNQAENRQESSNIAFEKQVRQDGVPHAAKRIAGLMNDKIGSAALARQFVLEELDAARHGDETAVNFVKNSGFSPSEYTGAMNQTSWEGDASELEYIQLFMRNFTNRLGDRMLMSKLSIAIVEEVMKHWQLGKYKLKKNG